MLCHFNSKRMGADIAEISSIPRTGADTGQIHQLADSCRGDAVDDERFSLMPGIIPQIVEGVVDESRSRY